MHSESQHELIWLLDLCGISELTELVCARNFPPLGAEGNARQIADAAN